MNLFLCNTPLHLIISLMVAYDEEMAERQSIFVVMEDSENLHVFAKEIIDPKKFQLICLSGRYNQNGILSKIIKIKSSASEIRNEISPLISNFYIFHDIIPESQAFLNQQYSRGKEPIVTLLEDGVALYGPGGVYSWNLIQTLKNKLISGWRWKGLSRVGTHPRISRIQCFYPKLLREDLKSKLVSCLPKNLPSELKSRIDSKIFLLDKNSTIIALPFIDPRHTQLLNGLIESSILFCIENQTKPVFKFHPRESMQNSFAKERLKEFAIAPQWIPIEVLLLANSEVHSFISSRTSALHISKHLFPSMRIAYFDDETDSKGLTWIEFLNAAGVPSLKRKIRLPTTCHAEY
ncbi:hypothetical protein [Ottowia thiooxydans]|uniref:Uncharacterized protein n=1 Tax=Ottowia thiooxydans TaxID=219182 RepID=A0ABV2QB98_9BURK